MTNETQPAPETVPSEVYGLFAGAIDQLAVQRFHNAISVTSAHGVKKLHILFQSSGGLIGEGISLYNLFRAAPIDIALYNVGSVSSIGVIAYMGAQERIVSTYGAFMIHRAYLSPTGATSDRMTVATEQLQMEDARIEAIIKTHAQIPPTKWDQHKYADVWMSAADSVSYKIADRIGEFTPPHGKQLFNVWPPQT